MDNFSVKVRVRGKAITGVLFEYVPVPSQPGTGHAVNGVIRVMRRGLCVEVPLAELLACAERGQRTLMAAVAAAMSAKG